jgi:hypothetical protein
VHGFFILCLQVFTSCMGELTMMKRQFDLLRRRPLMDFSFPHYAGGAIWALHFQHRLTRPMALLVHATPYLLESNHGPNLGVQYNLIITSIEQVGTYYLPDMYLCIMAPSVKVNSIFLYKNHNTCIISSKSKYLKVFTFRGKHNKQLIALYNDSVLLGRLKLQTKNFHYQI